MAHFVLGYSVYVWKQATATAAVVGLVLMNSSVYAREKPLSLVSFACHLNYVWRQTNIDVMANRIQLNSPQLNSHLIIFPRQKKQLYSHVSNHCIICWVLSWAWKSVRVQKQKLNVTCEKWKHNGAVQCKIVLIPTITFCTSHVRKLWMRDRKRPYEK